MAIAEELSREVAAIEEASEGAARVRLAIHDATRLEWSLSIPLPDERPIGYDLELAIEIPKNAFVRHAPWDQMQSFARLDGPAVAETGDVVTIDHLRRGALAMANQLARASDGFSRHCRLAASLFATAPRSELEDALTIWIEAAMRIAEDARDKLARVLSDDAEELVRERRLVDEYISVRLLEMLAGAGRALAGIGESKTPHADALARVAAAVEARLAEALAGELAYREEHRFTNADTSDPSALELYLDRASRLKKHFQEVLFLDPESYQVADRAYHWVAAFFAIVASTWAFAWQIALLNQARASQSDAATTLGSGVMTLALLAGLVYATKDRIKEIGRNWMTRRVHRFWGAQRVTRYRAPERRLPTRDVVVTARESFHQTERKLADTLNPHCNVRRSVTVLTYQNKGEVVPNAELRGSGVRRVKHVFRYDLSPLFARLDDALKPVPVLDGKKVRFIDAPRCYRVPITVKVSCAGKTYKEDSILVLHKRGLERLENEEASDPSLAEIGLEPN